MLRMALVFLAGVLVGANAVYFLMSSADGERDAVMVLERERSQHTEPPAAASNPAAVPTTRRPPRAAPAAEAGTRAAPPVTTAVDAPEDLAPQAPVRATPAAELIVPVRGIEVAQLSNTFDDARGQGRVHEAIDIMAPRGTPVLAVADGTVEKLFSSVPGGLTIYQFDPDGRHAFYYAHLDRYAAGLAEGQRLRQGEVIGYVGSTGNADVSAPHLHFAVFVLGPEKQWHQGTPINPYPLLGGQ